MDLLSYIFLFIFVLAFIFSPVFLLIKQVKDKTKIKRIIKATFFTICCIIGILFLIYATVHCVLINEIFAAVLFALSTLVCGFLFFCWIVDYWRF